MTKRWVCLTVAVLLVAGCSSGANVPTLAEPVPCEGIVTMDGEPLAGATVVFHPKAEAGFHGAMAVTDDSGKYVLESDVGNNKKKKGVIPGKYNVTVSRLVNADGKVIPYDPNTPPMNLGGREGIPMQYSTVNEMGLYYEVPASGGKFNIEISSTAGEA